jgi:hypothetical protein
MPLENAQYISELNKLWPLGTDGLNVSDDQHRVIKQAVQQSFPNIGGEVTADQDDLNTLTGAATLGSGLNPVGTRIEGYFITAPNGYLLCDGSAIDPQYSALIAIVGPNTPDERGRFSRGWTIDDTVDPDGPRAPLSLQDDAFQGHTHPVDGLGRVNPGSDTEGGGGDPVIQAFNTNTGAATGRTATETRPLNTAVLVCVKW